MTNDMEHAAGTITPAHFINRFGRRVLTNSGAPGMDGREGVGSTTELMLASFASLLIDVGDRLDNSQYEELLRWIEMCRAKGPYGSPLSKR